MDHIAARKRPRNARVHKYLPYLAHQNGYQIFRVTYGSQVSWCSAYIHPDRNGISRYLIIGCDLLIYRQNRAEAQTKDVVIWAWEPLAEKARKGWLQPTEQRIDQIWKVLGQPFQAARKEGHRKDKERYSEVV
jgi:hypothetical protein